MNKILIKIASTLFPKRIAAYAYKQLTNPQVRKLRQNELATLHKAEKETYPFKGFDIQLYHWRGSEKKIFLIHGWEGQAGNFSDLIEELLLNDYTIYAFDGPSHGYSSKGRTSLFEFTELVGVLIERFQVKHLISHSFGGVATTYALFDNKHLKIDTYILLTTPDKFIERIDDVSKSVGITAKVKTLLIKRLEKEVNMDITTLNVSDFVKSINVKKSLIIHDTNDKVLPISRSLNVHKNWSVSTFKEITGTGHFRILRTKKVIDMVVDYLS
ncbi:MAG: alpha/beta fold hydrolase [Croceivirga sp.]